VTPAQVAPLILAAGASQRMGVPKATLLYGEESALERILRTCRDCGLATPRVVTGAHAALTEAAAGEHPARFLHNPAWKQGRATSIQRGLSDLEGLEGALLWPVDACLPGAEVVRALLGPEASGVVPSHAGRRGHPLLLAARVFPRLLALGPDGSAREVVRALADSGDLAHVEVSDPCVLMNANTPQELERWGGRLP
jgi:molybdenum cofactor cytidylyltransferase